MVTMHSVNRESMSFVSFKKFFNKILFNNFALKRKKITGTIVEDTWTKSRGGVEVGEGGGFSWGGVEGWGEKAYNCN